MDGNLVYTAILTTNSGILVYDRKSIWVDNRTGSLPWPLVQIDFSGNIISEIPTPYVPDELCFDGVYFWGCYEDPNTPQSVIFQFDQAGNLINEFTHPYTIPAGFTTDGYYLWLVGDDENKVAQIDRDGNQIHEFSLAGSWPGPIAFAEGFLWLHDPLNDRFRQVDWLGNSIAEIPVSEQIYDIIYDGKNIISITIPLNISEINIFS